MANHHISSSEEDFSDHFSCSVCLDLYYKPVVLCCGHICCFWCVHKSMSGDHESHCPLCRHTYHHFPNICQLLHSLLFKLFPVTSKERARQIRKQEKKTGYFSPQLAVPAWNSHSSQDLDRLVESINKEWNASTLKTVSDSSNQDNGVAVSMPTNGGEFDGMENVTEQVDNSSISWQQSGSSNQLSVADALCAACKELLFHPVVLNCGHVYCESCLVKQDEQKLRCQVCECFHPAGFPKVCLDLHNFLDKQLHEELAHRRDAVQLNHVNATSCESKTNKEAENSSYHRRIGCDYCGMYPIIGKRYRCKDCVERMGFDLCSDCYNTGSKLPGRFNQQHTSEHQFEVLLGISILRGRGRILSEQILAYLGEIREEDAGNRELPDATSTSSENDDDDDNDDQDGSRPSFLHRGI